MAEVRDGMHDLIVRWRRMVSDTAGSVFQDWEAQEILDTHRGEMWEKMLAPVPVPLTGTVVYQTYLVGAQNVEGTASGTTAWRLYDSNGTAVTGYTLDSQRGIVSFTADQKGTAYYVDARS